MSAPQSKFDSSSQKKVLIICPGGLCNQGGVGKVVAYFTEAWKLTDNPPAYEVIDSRGVSSIWLSPIYFLNTIVKIIGKFSLGQVGLLHLHMSSYGSTVRKVVLIGLGQVLNIPIVLHLHGGAFCHFYRNLPKISQCIIRWVFQRVHTVIVLGSSWKEFLHDELCVSEERIVVMPNAVLIPKNTVTTAPHPQVKLLFLGRLATHKGVSILLRALASPNVKALNWEAVLAGDGDGTPYREEAAQLGIKERVHFPGWVDTAGVNDLLASSDIMILPSYIEGLPMAVLEGMAHGLAVIATSVGSIPDVITHNENGLLVSPGDDEELAKALERLMTDVCFRKFLSNNARQRIVEQFGIEAYAQKMKILYKECLSSEQKE